MDFDRLITLSDTYAMAGSTLAAIEIERVTEIPRLAGCGFLQTPENRRLFASPDQANRCENSIS